MVIAGDLLIFSDFAIKNPSWYAFPRWSMGTRAITEQSLQYGMMENNDSARRYCLIKVFPAMHHGRSLSEYGQQKGEPPSWPILRSAFSIIYLEVSFCSNRLNLLSRFQKAIKWLVRGLAFGPAFPVRICPDSALRRSCAHTILCILFVR